MKRSIPILSVVYSLMLSATFVRAQAYSQFYFTHANGENGSSTGNVKAILQDSYGFMWLSAKNGLSRYDGTSILQLNCDDLKTGIENHNISALYGDKERKLRMGTDRGIYVYDPTMDIFAYLNPKSSDKITSDNWVAEIPVDSVGGMWALTPDQGLFRFEGAKKASHYPVIGKSNFKSEGPECTAIDEKGRAWVETSGVGLFKYNPRKDALEQYLGDYNGHSLANKNIMNTCFRGSGTVIPAIHEGESLRYNTQSRELATIPFPGERKTFLHDVVYFRDELWVGSHHGFLIINGKKNNTLHLGEDLMRSFSLPDSIVCSIYKDTKGGIWIGTMSGGANYPPKHRLVFGKHVPESDDHSPDTKRIRGLVGDDNGCIWVGTEDNGTNVLDPQTGEVHQVYDNVPGYLIILCVRHYNNHTYCGLLKQGMSEIRLPDERIRCSSKGGLGIDGGSVYDFTIDSKGCKRIGTRWGLYVSGPNEKEYHRVGVIGYDWASNVMEAKDGTIWVASIENGVWKCRPKSGIYQNYAYKAGKRNTLSSNSIGLIIQDSRGSTWLSTDCGGICCYNEVQNSFTFFGINEGLSNDVCYDALKGEHPNLWFETNKGLARFNPESGDVSVFTNKDGLLGNQFNYNSALKVHDGRLCFGGVDGLIAFNPNTQNKGGSLPPVYISKFSIHNKEITMHTSNSPLKQCIVHTNEIELPCNRSNVSFGTAMPSYSTTETSQYYYRMVPLDKEWMHVASNKNISYAKLPPGKYTFQIKVAHHTSKSDPSTRSLTIVILSPQRQSVWAYTVYALAITLSVFCWSSQHKHHKERQMGERQKLFGIGKEKESYESKIDFFTETAHEVRTPLTLVNGPFEAIQEESLSESKRKKHINVIVQNTKRLLELTGQLFDFQKIGADKLSMKFGSVGITALPKGIVARPEVTSNLNNRELILKLTEEEIWAVVDKGAIAKVVSNLFNNALKYAWQCIQIELEKDDLYFTIRVISDGGKIPEEMSQYIFESFY